MFLWTDRYKEDRTDGLALLTCINGSPRRASRTGVLAGRLAEAIESRMAMRRDDVVFADVGLDVLSGLDRRSLNEKGDAICRTVESADVLIVASPVYRASYSGLMKHLFDLVDRDAMRGKVAALVATGGTPLHGLVVEHQMRPLMGFFGIRTVATALYGLEHEVELGGKIAAALDDRVEAAADEVAAFVGCDRFLRSVREAA